MKSKNHSTVTLNRAAVAVKSLSSEVSPQTPSPRPIANQLTSNSRFASLFLLVVVPFATVASASADSLVPSSVVQSAQLFAITRPATLNLVLITIVIVLIGLLIMALMAYQTMLKNVKSLQTAATAISRGRAPQPIKIPADDVIGELAKAFELMRLHINDSRQKLEHNNRVLGDEKARFLGSINSLPLAFLLVGHDGSISMVNPAMKRVLGAEAYAEATDPHIHPTNPLLVDILKMATTQTANKQKTNHELNTEDGRYFRVLTAPVLSATGIVRGVVLLVEDISEERILARSKDEFFSIASHELRTPLTAIRGNASMIQTLYSDVMKDADLKQMVDDIRDSSIRLIGIVNDFLDASRLEQSKMNFKMEVFNISEVVESVVYELTATLKEKNLYIKSDRTLNRLPDVIADKNRVKQIIYNLTGNALKFTDKGGLTIGAVVEGTHLHITITDTGRGISAENQSLLFHKFQQANDSLITRDTTRGTGLGLYISKLLTHNMGGKLTLDRSAPGVGSTFSFTLPLATAADKLAHPAIAGDMQVMTNDPASLK